MGFDESRDLFPEFSYTRFEIVRRGYARDQVDDAVDSLHADLQIVTADRDAATAQAGALARQLDMARRELEDARAHIHRLNKAPASTAGMSERLQKMMQIAQDEAAEIRARAESEYTEIHETAERGAEDLRVQYLKAIEELGRAREAVEQERAGIIAKARAEAARIDEESRRRRQRVEEDFEIAIAARRTKANDLVTEQERTSQAQAQARIQAAEQRSRAIVDEARARAEQLRTLRTQVADQLLAARGALDSATRVLAPAADEKTLLNAELPRQPAERPDDQALRPQTPTASTAATR